MGALGSIPGLGRSPGERIGCPLQYSWASLVAQTVKNLPAMWEPWVQSLGWEDPLEKGTVTQLQRILQYSGLENSRTVHRVAKSWTWLSNFHTHNIYFVKLFFNSYFLECFYHEWVLNCQRHYQCWYNINRFPYITLMGPSLPLWLVDYFEPKTIKAQMTQEEPLNFPLNCLKEFKIGALS